MRPMRTSYFLHSTGEEIEVDDLAKVALGDGLAETWVMPRVPENPHSLGTISVLSLSFAKLTIHALTAYSQLDCLHSRYRFYHLQDDHSFNFKSFFT